MKMKIVALLCAFTSIVSTAGAQTPTVTPTTTASVTPTVTSTPTVTATASGTVTPTATATATATATVTATATATVTATATPTSEPSALDQNFLIAAAQINNDEIVLSQFAAQKATRRSVRSFARTMIRDHTRAGALVAQLAQQLNTELPTEPDALHLVALDTLSTRKGRAIDESYVYQMILDHEQAIRLYRNEIAAGTDPKVRAFARVTLPVLRRHLRDAILLARSLRISIVRR